MAVQRLAVELCQDIYLADVAVDAATDGDVNKSVLSGNRNGRLGPVPREGHEPGTYAATQNNRYDIHCGYQRRDSLAKMISFRERELGSLQRSRECRQPYPHSQSTNPSWCAHSTEHYFR